MDDQPNETPTPPEPREPGRDALEFALLEARNTCANLSRMRSEGDGRTQFLLQLGVGLLGGAIALLSGYRFAGETSTDLTFVAPMLLGFTANLTALGFLLHSLLSFNTRKLVSGIDVADLELRLYRDRPGWIALAQDALKDYRDIQAKTNEGSNDEARTRRFGLWLLTISVASYAVGFIASSIGNPAS